VGTLTRHLRPIGTSEPRPAELGQGVGPPLGRAPAVLLTTPRPGVLQGAERGDDRLTRLGIQVSVDPDRAFERGRDVKAPIFEDLPGPLLCTRGIRRLAPVEIAVRRSRTGSANAASTSIRSASPKASGAASIAPSSKSTASEDRSPSPRASAGPRHVPECPRDLHVSGGAPESQAQPRREPGDHREVAVDAPGPLRSTSTNRRDRSASSTREARSSSIRPSPRSSSDAHGRSSPRSSSSPDRSVLMEPTLPTIHSPRYENASSGELSEEVLSATRAAVGARRSHLYLGQPAVGTEIPQERIRVPRGEAESLDGTRNVHPRRTRRSLTGQPLTPRRA
jgi:hypothetical protein